MSKEEELFSCSYCEKVIPDNTEYDVVCCSLSPDLRSLFPKFESGRVTNILLGERVIRCGIPGRGSPADAGGVDLTFIACSPECKKGIEDLLEDSGLNAEKVEREG